MLFVAFLAAVALAASGPATEQEGQAGQEKEAGPAAIGHPMAPGIMTLLEDEMKAGFKRRGIEDHFARFRSYAAWKLDSTAGTAMTSEVTGNCRLNWYDHLLRNPIQAPAQAEQFTRELHTALAGNHEGFARALAIARRRMDRSAQSPRSFTPVDSPEKAMAIVKQALIDAQVGYASALAPLDRNEIGQLARSLYPTLTSQATNGHTLPDRGTARRLCDLMEKSDLNGFYAAAEGLVPLADPKLLEHLAAIPDEGRFTVEGVSGTVLQHMVTPAGDIIVGGREKNTYQLDKMSTTAAVIDLGGDDVYQEGAVSLQRPLLVVLDLSGNDVYRGSQPGIQGGAVLGVSMLVDAAGNDSYQAKDVAQGSALAGVGILVDCAGNDAYVGLRRLQGHALAGVGVLIDRQGHDRYHGAMWTQGFGAPLGFGVLEDGDGNDRYYTGGQYPDSYEETPGYEGWGQGVGAGLRQVGDGGIGVLLEGGGDDTYEFDYLAHGGGYWLGVGFARDFGGNDKRLGATRQTYSGGTRTERMFQRFSSGYGCHYAVGFCFDDAGNDSYNGTIMALGFAWDVAVGGLIDFAGNDRYEATGGGTQGNGAQAGLGILFDYAGDDVYLGYGQGNASASISYHDLPRCGGNFSFVVDYGGKDQYGCGVQNNSYNRRGSDGGFLIDRPSRDEQQQTAAAPSDRPAAGS
ncbi:MAG: hypothetical protein HUU20_15735 [Pirellulales bacterium]|nr:hypothetical protein [Pirellulales bacterium]